jgi:ureidoacrylate peracid hydrolase
MKVPVLAPASHPVLLQAEPDPLEIDLKRTAVLVIDMQNVFVSKGGYFDLMGFNISSCAAVIGPIAQVLNAARERGIRVIHVVHLYSPDLRETGGENSGNWYRNHLVMYRNHPEWADRFFIQGTWGAEIVKELQPPESEMVVAKPRYSAFFGTALDLFLKTFQLKYLCFMGVDTAICVESSIRDAYNLDYFPILVSDASASTGAPFSQEAAILNIKHCFGWVTDTRGLIDAFQTGRR